MLSIARSELVQLLRNRSVLVAGMIIPLTVCAFFIWKRDVFEELGGLGYIAATVAFTVTGFGLYSTAVTTLASRRQNLFLKRLRSTAASDRTILLGLVLPVTALAILQVAGILAVFASVSSRPDAVPLVAAAVAATVLMMLALALATAGLTNSPEHAQVTTLPVSLGTVAVSAWVGISGTADLTWLKRLLPGGAPTELVSRGWDGGVPTGDAVMLFAVTAGWVVVAAVLAVRMFRWEPRR